MGILKRLLKSSFSKPDKSNNKSIDSINLKNAEKLGTDLVEADYFLGCCEECAKYRGRWFSISGKDKRFPIKPQKYKCTCQGINFDPVVYGISKPIYCPKGMNIITYSNRPFIDDRTDEEKEMHQFYIKEQENEKWFSKYRKRIEKLKSYDKENFLKLKSIMPDISPKSFSGYMKMKKNNSKNYQKLKQLAMEKGLFLDYPEDLKKEYDFLMPIQERYNKTKAECFAFWQQKRNT